MVFWVIMVNNAVDQALYLVVQASITCNGSGLCQCLLFPDPRIAIKICGKAVNGCGDGAGFPLGT